MKGVLVLDGSPVDYKLRDKGDHVWITINDLAIYVGRTGNAVNIKVFEDGNEIDATIGELNIVDLEVV